MKFFSVLASALLLSPLLCQADFASEVLAEMNLARTQPQVYARIVAEHARPRSEGQGAIREAVRFLEKAKPLPALTASDDLARACSDHVRDTGPRGVIGHRGTDGSRTWTRIDRYGRWIGSVAENISYGATSARDAVVRLIVDDGVRGRKHRANIFGRDFRVAGAATGHHARWKTMVVTNFAAGYVPSSGRVAGL